MKAITLFSGLLLLAASLPYKHNTQRYPTR